MMTPFLRLQAPAATWVLAGGRELEDPHDYDPRRQFGIVVAIKAHQ